MSELAQRIRKLLKEDRRYKADAYHFVQEALHYTQHVLKLGQEAAEEEEEEIDEPDDDKLHAEELTADELLADDLDDDLDLDEEPEEAPTDSPPRRAPHLTGQQLCQGIREYALEQYGLMAKIVLNSWGIRSTGDFGEIVYNLIAIGSMKKSPSDRREDFDNVYDFDEAFRQNFRMKRG